MFVGKLKENPSNKWENVRDLFRQHINHRRNSADSSLLMPAKQVEDIGNLKTEVLAILKHFDYPENSTIDQESYESLNDFIGKISRDEELLQYEIWKLQNIIENTTVIAEETDKLSSPSKNSEGREI